MMIYGISIATLFVLWCALWIFLAERAFIKHQIFVGVCCSIVVFATLFEICALFYIVTR